MFTILSYKIKVNQNETVQCHNVHMSFEVEMALRRLGNNVKIIELTQGQTFKSLDEAQKHQAQLRQGESK